MTHISKSNQIKKHCLSSREIKPKETRIYSFGANGLAATGRHCYRYYRQMCNQTRRKNIKIEKKRRSSTRKRCDCVPKNRYSFIYLFILIKLYFYHGHSGVISMAAPLSPRYTPCVYWIFANRASCTLVVMGAGRVFTS